MYTIVGRAKKNGDGVSEKDLSPSEPTFGKFKYQKSVAEGVAW